MSKSAYIQLVSETCPTITLAQVRELLAYYQEMTQQTGKQLDWDYQGVAFPYNIIEKEQSGRTYLLLEGKDPRQYHSLLIGVNTKAETSEIQIVLPDQATHGDQAKANELSRFLAKQVKGELQMFNGRIMYFYKRK